MTAEELLERLDSALASTSDEIELSAEARRRGMTRFAGGRVTAPGLIEDVVVRARVARGARIAAARTNDVSREGISRAIHRARSLADAQPETIDFAGFAARQDERDPPCAPTMDDETASARRLDWTARAIAAIGRAGLVAAGCALSSTTSFAVATTRGRRRAFSTDVHSFEVIAHEDKMLDASSGREGFVLDPAHAPDLDSIASLAIETALRGREASHVDDGSYDVLLEPPAVAELIDWLALVSFGAQSVLDGSSCLTHRQGQRILGPLDVYDDALSGDAGCPRLLFDAEGVSKTRHDFFRDGVAGGPVHDRQTARRAGEASTGHAISLEDDPVEAGPQARHLHVGSGETDSAQLLAALGDGLVVKRFHYVSGLLDPRRAVMTGMTRDGVLRVAGGRVVGAAKNLRFTESLLEAATRIAAISRARTTIASSRPGVYVVAPSLLVRGWSFLR